VGGETETPSLFGFLLSSAAENDVAVTSGNLRGVTAVLRTATILTAVTLTAGCLSGAHGERGVEDRDIAAARRFGAFPLYWAGPRFEKWDLVAIQGLRASRQFVSFIYGECAPRDGEQPSCAPPFEIQISPLCAHLDVVASDRVWRTRHVRGAPVGRSPDGAPVLFSRRAQVKVYRGQGSAARLPFRVLRALRSVNRVRPIVGPGDVIPSPAASVLAGSRPCG
jgi:hypothetical protein